MGNPLSLYIGPGTVLSPNKSTFPHIPHTALSLTMHWRLLPSSTCNWLHLSNQMFGCSVPCDKESCQLNTLSFLGPGSREEAETTAFETLSPQFVALSRFVSLKEGLPQQ